MQKSVIAWCSIKKFWSENFHKLRNTRDFIFEFWTSICQSVTRRNVQCSAVHSQSTQPSNLRHEFLDESVTATAISKQLLGFSESNCHCDAQQKILKRKDLKHPVKILVIDIETTGFSRKSERVIEIALRDLLGGQDSCFQTLVNPEQVIQNSYIHGITNCMVNQPHVPRMKDLIPILKQYIGSCEIPGASVILVAHNGCCFDFPFLIKEFNQCSQEIPLNWLFLDTLPLARELRRLKESELLRKVSLQSLREYYGIPPVSSAHRAMSDVNLLSSIFGRMTFDLKLTVTDLLKRSVKPSQLLKPKKMN